MLVRLMQRYLFLALLIELAACAPPVSVPSQAPPFLPWSVAVTVAEAFHLDAPAVGLAGEAWAVVWADGPDLFFCRVAPDGARGPVQMLNLGGRTPWNPVLLPAPEDGWHLLWQDVDIFGDARLFSARLAADGLLLRGPVAVSAGAVTQVAAAPGDAGAAIVVWADDAPRPTLYGQRIDAQGRPVGAAVEIARGASHPALARTAGGLWALAWLSSDDAGVSRQALVRLSDRPLPWEGEAEAVALGEVSLADVTAYVETVRLGLDRAHGYLFIGHRDAATGLPRTDALIFSLEADSAGTSVVRLEALALPAAAPATTPDVTTGFNTGPAFAPPSAGEGISLGWPVPAWGQFDALPVAFEADGAVVVGYFQGGGLIGWQPVGVGARAGGTPGLWTDRERHLTLAWADLPDSADGPAALRLCTTRSLVP